ncbi:MAG: sulfite exporter TauE/SafE family protein [Candidatus Abyssobacteria bacterium SURF_17]|uniref:Probable membrane transporter protein n=1 Tax=Candidatus Abyssobacteria bacterium SURF_17 TaxID=2093361 RepID=A0A419EU95_9BACT|nr:MAG: sulfite exporter TauE/SafE family protein [Candidatus Abyssubacteria bacterium SURF_17]
MEHVAGEYFIHLDLYVALQVILLGFIGGTLSGFIGSGGAFFMTPGMMNLGVQGVVAVGSNIAHKFGKAMVGSRKHGEMGNVDKKLALFLVLTSYAGIWLAVWINSKLFAGGGGGEHGAPKGAGANLYISIVFITILSVVALSMLRDVMRTAKDEGMGPSRKISEFLSRLRLPPMIYFKVADVKVSLWVLMMVGLATGYLAGTIGVGGFIGVPAMIYVFGIPTAVAAGTELYLAMFMGAWGAVNYAWQGFVDIRLTMLMYLGSLLGIYIGAYGVKVVNEVYIRLVTGLIIIICALSRGVAIPMYLRQLGYVNMDPAFDTYFNGASKVLLFLAGFGGVAVILFHVFRAHRRRRSIQVVMEYAKT